jgi:hypothetical protein
MDLDALLEEARAVELPSPLADLLAQAQQFKVLRPWKVFVSGVSTQPGQMWGLAEMGYGVGLSLGEAKAEGFRYRLAVLRRMLDTPYLSVTLLVDSGAIKEARTGGAITAREWDRRMALYLDAARLLGPAAWLIAPDKVGDQAESIRRFQRQVPRLRQMLRAGAVVLLPLQSGALSQRPSAQWADLPDGLARQSGWSSTQLVPALPMRPKGGATVTPLPRLLAFLRQRRPPVVHLLGIGPGSVLLPRILWEIEQAVPGTRVSIDAALVRPLVGTTQRPGPWTVARQPMMQQVAADWRVPQAQFDLTEATYYLEGPELAAAVKAAGAPQQVFDQIANEPALIWELYEAMWDEEHPWFGVVYQDALTAQIQRAYVRAVPKFGAGVPRQGRGDPAVAQRDRRLAHHFFGEDE